METFDPAKRSLKFDPVQNIHKDIWSMPAHLPNPMCHDQGVYPVEKGYYWQYSYNTIIGPLKHDSILCIKPVNREYK